MRGRSKKQKDLEQVIANRSASEAMYNGEPLSGDDLDDLLSYDDDENDPRSIILASGGSYKIGGCTITPTGIDFPDNIPEQTWREIGKTLLRLETALIWALIDWVEYGQLKWGETYQKIAAELGVKTDTIYTYVSEGRKISIRNRDLSFAHHRLVASRDEDEQRELLQLAADNKWTIKQLKRYIWEIDHPAPPDTDDFDPDPYDRTAMRKSFNKVSKFIVRVGDGNKYDSDTIEDLLARSRAVRRWLEQYEGLLSKGRIR